MTRGSKEWVDNRVKQQISQYEQKDEKRTKSQLILNDLIAELRLKRYEQKDKRWTKETFEAKVPLEQLVKAYYSTYQVVNKAYYETREGNVIYAGRGFGSGILFNGGYLLTAKHVVDERFPREFSHSYWGLVRYHHNEISINGYYGLEKVLLSNSHDYALFKLKENLGLSYYSFGFNLPNSVKPGMRSAAIGFPLGLNRNIRLGNVSQTESNVGRDYLTFKNSIIPGDSGGPLFVVEDGNVKLVAISTMLTVMRDWNVPGVSHPTNIGYGLKVETILKDMKEQLASKLLDEGAVKELNNFLKLNKY